MTTDRKDDPHHPQAVADIITEGRKDEPTTTTKLRCWAHFTAFGVGYIIACNVCGWADVGGNFDTACEKARAHDGR